MSSRKRSLYSEDRGDRKRHKESKHDVEKLKKQATKLNQEVQKLKHVKTFYEKPPGFIKRAGGSVLVVPSTNMTLLPCASWRCKRYGHRTGDRECPFFIKGNQKLEQFRVAHKDPMYDMIRENKQNGKETSPSVSPTSTPCLIQQLQQLLQDATSSSDSSSSSSSTSESKKRKHKKN
eukprot:XP_014033959.1 PREDICTED: retinitis pigmentosa 9 protein homolog [Salmo salar]